jgi:hypothetical protein
MRLAHLILTHAFPEQLSRLVNKLSHEYADFYIHVDLKTNVGPFLHLAEKKNVFFIQNRVKVYWGGYSIVQATLNGFKEILGSGIPYDYINLLSGQDYPVKSASYIHKYFTDNPGKAFMHSLSLEHEWTDAMTRITRYHLANVHFPGKYRLEKLINRLLPKRKFPYSLTPVGRSQWFTITPSFAAYIIDYLARHRRFRWFFKLSWAADETIFQTILYNSKYQLSMINDNLLYVDWSEGKPNPKVLTMKDAEVLKNQDKLFARKFNLVVDSNILDYLDNLAASNA